MTLTLLIDLDDTLLPGSTPKFLPAYLSALADYIALPIPKEKFIEIIYWATNEAVTKSQIDKTIKERFDQIFYPALGTTAKEQAGKIEKFYDEEFPKFSPVKQPDPKAIRLIESAFEKGYRVAVATNPIFPQVATYERLRWAGVSPEKYPLEIVTTYEYFHFGKPSLAFYLELIAQIGWPDGGYVMVGDNLDWDVKPAKALGIPSYWVNPKAGPADLNAMHTSGRLDQVQEWIEARDEGELSLSLTNFDHNLATLRANPAAIDTLLRQSPSIVWEPGPKEEEWQIHEILCHLRDVDLEVHTPRLEMIRDEPAPFLPAIDADSWADERQYYLQDGRQAWVDFIQARKSLLDLAANLPEVAAEKEIRHSIFGPIDLNEILRIAGRHDSLHVQQIRAQLGAKSS
jgi:FMN phosphatase YigB (HAD superfamily)